MRHLSIGDRITKEIPWSEAAMSLRVAGHVMDVEIVPGHWHPMAQLWQRGERYSFPILPHEAGIYTDHHGLYVDEWIAV